MKKNKKKPLVEYPPEPVLEVPEEEPPRQRAKRYFRILAASLALIAALFWVLSSSRPKPNSPENIAQGENSPDAVIEKFHLVSTVQGMKRWELYSDKARLYQSQKVAYADNIYAEYYKDDKLVSTLTADDAVINTDTNATEAQGHVELIVENGSKLETDKLKWNPDTDQIRADGKVHVYKGKDEITAVGMVADTQLNNIRFMRDVHTEVRDTGEIENYNEKKAF